MQPTIRRQGRRSGSVAAALAVATMVISGLCGCTSNTQSGGLPLIAPASAAQSPPLTTPAAGTVHRFAGHTEAMLLDAATKTLLVLHDGGAAVTAFTVGAIDAPRFTVPLAEPATALTGDGAGTAYLSTRGGFYRADIAAGQVRKVDIAGHGQTAFTAIARRADTALVLGDDHGTVYTLGAGHAENDIDATAGGFARIDSLAVQGNTVIALDRAQILVTTISEDGRRTVQALRAGEGATTALVDDSGRLLVADTRGGALLVFGTDPLILRQRYPVPDSPYGLAHTSRLVWVSQTATNTVVGYDLSTGIPEERARYSTVRQPNSLASDGTTLYVASGVGDGLETIDIGGAG